MPSSQQGARTRSWKKAATVSVAVGVFAGAFGAQAITSGAASADDPAPAPPVTYQARGIVDGGPGTDDYLSYPFGDPAGQVPTVYRYISDTIDMCNTVLAEIRQDPELVKVVWPTYVVSPEVQASQAWIDANAARSQMRAYPEFVDPGTGVAYSDPAGVCVPAIERDETLSSDDPAAYRQIGYEFTAAQPTITVTPLPPVS